MYLRIDCRKKLLNSRGVFTDPVRCATQTFLAFGSKIWWFGARILRSLKILSSTYRGNLIPKTALLSQKEALRGLNFKRYVEGECIHIGNLIPKTALLSQKAALRDQISRGMVEGECIHRERLIPKTALLIQKEALRKSNFKRYYGRSGISMCIHYPSTIPLENWFP